MVAINAEFTAMLLNLLVSFFVGVNINYYPLALLHTSANRDLSRFTRLIRREVAETSVSEAGAEAVGSVPDSLREELSMPDEQRH